MNTIPEELYSRIQKISEEVKRDLRRKGLVVPIKQSDGSITLGTYTIVKDLNGYKICLLYTSPSPRDGLLSRMPSSA